MRTWLVYTALVLGGLSGCLGSRELTPIRYYRIDGLLTAPAGATRTRPVTLGVRVLNEAMRYRDRMLYRLSDVEIRFYEYDRWVEPPGEMVTQVIMASLRASGIFQHVTSAIDAPSSAWILSGDVLRFDEVRSASGSRAECQLQFELRRARDEQLLWADVITATAPLPTDSRSAFAHAMHQAVQHATSQLIEALQTGVDVQG